MLHQWESISLGALVTGVLCSDYIHSTVRAAKRTSSERRDTEWNRGESVLCRGGGYVDPGFFSFSFFGGVGGEVSWMRNGKSGRLVDVCNRVFEVLVTLR